MPNFKKDDVYVPPIKATGSASVTKPKVPSFDPVIPANKRPAGVYPIQRPPVSGGRGGSHGGLAGLNARNNPPTRVVNIPALRLAWSPIFGLVPVNVTNYGPQPPGTSITAGWNAYANRINNQILNNNTHNWAGINYEDYLHIKPAEDPWAIIEANRARSLEIMAALDGLETEDEGDLMFEDAGGGGWGDGWGDWGGGGGTSYGPDSMLYMWRIGF